jgi:hypothetical protein
MRITYLWSMYDYIVKLWGSLTCEVWVTMSLIYTYVCVVHLFSLLCCHIMCLYVLSSVLWCPLRFPHRKMFDSSLPPVGCRMAHVLLCVFSYSDVQHFSFLKGLFVCLSSSCVLCTQYCQFLWIVQLWLPLLFPLTFISQQHCIKTHKNKCH